MIELNRPDVVFIQENLGLNEDVTYVLELLLLGWKFVVVDVHG